MPDPAVIDLGLPRREPEPAPWLGEGWRRHWSGRTRWFTPAATVVLAFSLAGAAPLTGSPLERIWSIPSTGDLPEFESRYVLGADRLYELAADRLAAYDLAGGQVVWEVDPDLEESLRMRLIAGTLVVVSAAGNRTDGFDTSTGEHLWSFPVGPSYLGAERLMLVPDPVQVGEMVEVDLATGETHTRHGFARPPDAATELAADGRHQFQLATDGTLTRVDLETGATTRVRVGPGGRVAGAGYDRLWWHGDLLIVGRSGGDAGSLLTAYDPVTLTPLWSSPGSYSQQCHRLLCVGSREGPQPYLRAVEPATGQARWTLRCPRGVGACHGPTIQELPGDRLWVTVARAGGEVEVTRGLVVDGATGEALSRVTSWDFREAVGASTWLLRRVDPAAPGRVRWAWADADLGRVGGLGVVDAETCDLRYPHLACLTTGESVEIWRFGG